MKQILKVISVLTFFLLYFSIFSCKSETETEYITKTETEYVEKKYAEAVVFTAEDVASACVKVTMSTATKGAKIYYTTDGIEPTEKSVLYSRPVNFTKDVTVKAVAIKTGMENSPVAVATVSMTEKTVTVEVEKEPDSIPPGKIILTENSVVAGNSKVLLSWQNPDDEDFYGTRVLFTPATEDETRSLVIKGEKSGSSSILINGLENEIEYTFSLIALDKNQNESEAVTINATPVTPPDTSDKIAPGEVLNLSATPFNKRVKLEWNDPSDEDLFGIEVSWAEVSDGSRAVSAMDEKSLFVAPGMECIEVPVLENDVEYQFSVKTMDVSGNKSAGVVINSTPKSSEPLKIKLSVPDEKSNTSVIVTANIITDAQDVIKVVCKKDGSESAEILLSDSETVQGIKNDVNFKEWTLKINATDESYNGTYMVAAIDSDGREETSYIKINNFDFTPPDKVNLVSKKYEKNESLMNCVFTKPADEDFDHLELAYTIYDGNKDSELSVSEIVIDNKKSFDITEIGSVCRTYYIVSVDKIGNKSEPVSFKVLFDGFKEIPAISIKGNEVWEPESEVFKKDKAFEIPSFYMCDHPVTRAEYKELIGKDPSIGVAYDKKGNKLEGEAVGNNPVNNISWYDAIHYCNALSIKKGLSPYYAINGISDPNKWEEYSSLSNSKLYKLVTRDFSADGYRLPTEAEWEWAARGGEKFKYAGSDEIDEVAWYSGNICKLEQFGTVEVKAKNANGYGLYDMSGNIAEWCWAPFFQLNSSNELVVMEHYQRGGSFKSYEARCTVFVRLLSNSIDEWGFRLVRSSL